MKVAGTAVVVFGVALLALAVAWLGRGHDSEEQVAQPVAHPNGSDWGQERAVRELPKSDDSASSSKESSLLLPAEEHSLDEVTEAPEQEVESISAEFDAHLRERLLPVIRRIYEDIASVAQLSKEEEQALIDLLKSSRPRSSHRTKIP